MFQYMDVLSHYCYQPRGSITDSEMVGIRKLVSRMDTLWRKLAINVPPKVHAWWHLLKWLERLRGLKSHLENKIEVAHQVGKQTELRFRSMAAACVDRKIKASMKYQANKLDPKMLARQQEIRDQRSRKLGEKSKAARAADTKEAKRSRQDHIQTIINLPEVEGSFSTMLELAVIDRAEECGNLAIVADIRQNMG